MEDLYVNELEVGDIIQWHGFMLQLSRKVRSPTVMIFICEDGSLLTLFPSSIRQWSHVLRYNPEMGTLKEAFDVAQVTRELR